MSSIDEIRDDLHDLLFDIRRSIRYHNCRRSFFESLQTVSQVCSVIFGSATFFAVLSSTGKTIPMVAAAVVTLLSTINIVIGPTKRAQLHTDLARRFIDLERAVIGSEEETTTKVSIFRQQRLEIERDEPATLRCLDSICHNEQLRADGYGDEYLVVVKSYQRFFANVIDINSHKIKPAASLHQLNDEERNINPL